MRSRQGTAGDRPERRTARTSTGGAGYAGQTPSYDPGGNSHPSARNSPAAPRLDAQCSSGNTIARRQPPGVVADRRKFLGARLRVGVEDSAEAGVHRAHRATPRAATSGLQHAIAGTTSATLGRAMQWQGVGGRKRAHRHRPPHCYRKACGSHPEPRTATRRVRRVGWLDQLHASASIAPKKLRS